MASSVREGREEDLKPEGALAAGLLVLQGVSMCTGASNWQVTHLYSENKNHCIV